MSGPLIPIRLDQASLEYTAQADIDQDLDYMPVGSAANAGKIAKTKVSVLFAAMRQMLLDNGDLSSETPSLSFTGDATLTAADIQANYINNYGASIPITLTLPPPVAGMYGQFSNLMGVQMSLNPGGSYAFDGMAVGDPLNLFSKGDVYIYCVVDGIWNVTNFSAVTERYYAMARDAYGEYNIMLFGAKRYSSIAAAAAGTSSSAALNAAHAAASTASPPGIVTAPAGYFRLATGVVGSASMRGAGGHGYSAAHARTCFVPTMTDGTAAIKATLKGGLHWSKFAVEANVSSPNPNPSGGNVQQCIGIQWGKAPALITGITLANPCVVNLKYLHGYDVGDVLRLENISGTVELNYSGANNYTVTAVSRAARTITLNVNSSGFTPYVSGGITYPSDLGTGSAVTRSVLEDVVVGSCAVNAHVSGWLNRLALWSFNGTLGFDGGYLNTGNNDLITENCWQAFQLMGCNAAHFSRIEDEGGGVNDLGSPSTIDYSNHVSCDMYSGEGTRRSGGGAWLTVGGASFCRDVHFYDGFIDAGASSGVSVALAGVFGWTLPKKLAGGHSTTGSTSNYNGRATFAAATTVAVTFGLPLNSTDYKVLLSPEADPVGRLWVSGKTASGFTINNSSSTSIAVAWQVER